MNIKKSVTLVSVLGLCSALAGNVLAQSSATTSIDGRVNTINTAVPFLRIDPDARSGAMGDVGIAISPDANAGYWNNAKIPFATQDLGLAVTYTPWLRELVNDIYLADLSGYYKIDDIQGINASLRYFNLGSIDFTNIQGQAVGTGNPHEFAVDAGYSRKITDNFGIGVTLRYITSDLANGQQVAGVVVKPGHAEAGDLDFYYQKDEAKISTIPIKYAFGLAFTNIGSKISYTDNALNKDYLPMNLGLGSALTLELDKFNEITFAIDVNKLLAPTPDTIDANNNGVYDYKELSVPSAIISALTEAPGGFSEKIDELMYSFGAEYWYKDKSGNDLFAVRAGYYNENKLKGDRKYLTAGLGIKYNVFGLNFSYLIPTNSQKNPLDNTLRFTLMFNFDALKKAPEKPEQNSTN